MGGRINLIDGRKLKIDPTQLSDQGIWQATATNKAGSSQHAIYLKIQEELEFVDPPSDGKNTYIAQYTTVVFPCNVRGTPTPNNWEWYRQGHLNEPFRGLPARAYEDESHSLVIPYSQTWDNGTYVCNVTNEYFQHIWGSAVLVVIEPPSIVVAPEDYNVNVFGESSTLKCKCEPQAVAVGSCVVEFRKDGVKVTGAGISVAINDYTSILTISNTQETDLGEYECHGSNDYGSASAFAYITKAYKPYIVDKPAASITTSGSSSVSLKCEAIGARPINYEWFFNGFPLADDNRYDTSVRVVS